MGNLKKGGIMQKFLIKIGKKTLFFDKREIDRIEADSNYIRVFVNERSYIIRNTLRSVEKKLDPERFIRINRSTIVNVECIRELIENDNKEYKVILKNEIAIKWGKHYRKNLARFLRL